MDITGIYSVLGERVGRRRQGLGMTQQTLADGVGLTRASIANIEAGKQRVLLHTVYLLLQVLELRELEDLLPRLVPLVAGEPDVPAFGIDEILTDADRDAVTRIWRDFAPVRK